MVKLYINTLVWRKIALLLLLTRFNLFLIVGCGTENPPPEDSSQSKALDQSSETSNNSSQEMLVTFLDVGQGDSTFIELPNGKTMLIDAGDTDDGQSITNYIKSKGYSDINYLVATHPHEDHIEGMLYVVELLNIGLHLHAKC